MNSSETVTRADFVKNLVQAGFTYVNASAAFDSFVKTIEDGVCAGSKINFAKVGSLDPVSLPPRQITMGFKRVKKIGIEKTNKTYYLGSRIKYKFILYKRFKDTHTLRWNIGS